MVKQLARPIQILIVDDHPLIRDGLAALISKQADMEICGEAEDEGTAMRLVREIKPDVIIIDISLKQGNGMELIKQVRAHNPDIRMIVSSMHDENLFAERALHAGAMGYINKQEGSREIVAAIRSVQEGNVYLSRQASNRLLVRLAQRRDRSSDSPIEELTDREVEVFELVGQGLSVREIAQQLYLSPKTIERYRENIKHKLNLQSATELVRYATSWLLENGWDQRGRREDGKAPESDEQKGTPQRARGSKKRP